MLGGNSWKRLELDMDNVLYVRPSYHWLFFPGRISLRIAGGSNDLTGCLETAKAKIIVTRLSFEL